MVSSSELASEISSFRDFGLLDGLVQAIEASGYTVPTPIQARTIPLLLEGRDVLGQAQTGTGKTAAFALPMLQRIDLSVAKPQVLVLTPTRELAIQVAEAFERYAQCMPGLRVAAIYGGQDYQIQFRQLDRGTHVVVGTPGRVMDHMRRNSLRLDAMKGLVLDEADEMLRMGFAEDVEWILTQVPTPRQIALFSATIPDPIRRIAAQHLQSPAHITIQQQTATADTIRQRFIIAGLPQKQVALRRLLESEPIDAVLVFVKTKSTCDPLADYLADSGHRTAALHGDIAQKQRERIVEQLRSGQLDVIVATDVAARGLDVQRISHVFNYDLPFDSEAYVHRIGRTGRAGRSGEAILFVTPRERARLKRLEHATRQRIAPMELPTNREINKRRVEKFHERISGALNHPQSETFASVVEQFRRAHPEITAEQLATALAVLAHGDAPLLEKGEFQSASFQASPFQGERRGNERGDRFDRSGPRDMRNESRGPRPPRRNESMETFRIEVGNEHQVAPGHIVGAIANEIGIDSSSIGRITIHDQFSTVDLPEGMPPDVFQTLKRVFVLGQRLQISRLDDSGSQPPTEKPEIRRKKGKRKLEPATSA